MKKISCAVLGMSLFLLGCGGDSSSSVSAVVTSANDESLAASAVSSAPWKSETVVSSSTAQKTTANQNIQSLVTSIVASQSGKKDKSTTTNIDKSVSGTNGGTASVKGTVEAESTAGVIYPITTKTNLTLKFDGYVGPSFSLHGETEYAGTTTVSSQTKYETTFTSNGGYSYKDSTGVYSFATEMTVTFNYEGTAFTGTYKFVVNGETITGTF